MKGFVIKWQMRYYDDRPLFAVYQVPLNCVSDFCIVRQNFEDKTEGLPFAFIECQIIARNKKSAIAKFAKRYKVPVKNNVSYDYKY